MDLQGGDGSGGDGFDPVSLLGGVLPTDTGNLSPYDRHLIEKAAGQFRLTPATLYSRIDPTWIPKQFLLKAALQIARAIAQGNKLITVSAPPRHGKSRLTTIATPVWVLEVLRTYHVILCTYGGDLSTDFGREVKDIAGRNEDLLSFKLRRDVQRNDHWLTSEGGGMTSVGIGGPITGRGANVLLIDDYIKEIEEAESAVQREKQWRWLTNVALTRLEPNACCIITATRWHEDDIIGRIKRGMAGPEWQHINYPAEFLPKKPILDGFGKPTGKFEPDLEATDDLGRRYGDVLFEERYNIKQLKMRRTFLGNRMYDALFQQEPHGSSAIKCNRDWIHVEKRGLVHWHGYIFVRVWDVAGTKNGGDYTVGMLLAIHPLTGDVWIIDVQRGQWSALEIDSRIRDCAIQDGTGCTIIFEQEPGSSGKNYVEIWKVMLPGFEVLGSPTTTSKDIRARPFVTAAENGKVHCLDREWTEEFLEEFDGFLSRALHDDQVDCGAIGFNHVYKMPDSGVVFGRNVVKIQETARIVKDAEGLERAAAGIERSVAEAVREITEGPEGGGQVTGLTWGRNRQSRRGTFRA